MECSQKYLLNGIDNCPFIGDVHVQPSKKGYSLSTQGKNGEVFGGEKIDVELYHRFMVRPMKATVTTDPGGLAELGQLPEIVSVTVAPRNPLLFSKKSFQLLQDMVNVPHRINRKAGTEVLIPFSSNLKDGPVLSLFDRNFGNNFSEKAKFEGGYITLDKLSP